MTVQQLKDLVRQIDGRLSSVDPDTAANAEALEAYDWINAIQDVRLLIKKAKL